MATTRAATKMPPAEPPAPVLAETTLGALLGWLLVYTAQTRGLEEPVSVTSNGVRLSPRLLKFLRTTPPSA